MRTYVYQDELKADIETTFEKYILEFDNITENLKDKSVYEVDRTPVENLAY
ncbi:ClbS/DfsB family four-helix bundle protein, partial [Streptococcus pneumoniae]|uniref:ClbS/DfsB family four-helix bundle protein n=1 Tax=Streptococcus pneumoniae TaxID=1313 RepID=UPI000A775654